MKGYRTVFIMGLAAVPPLMEVLLPILQLPQWRGVIPQEWWSLYTLLVAIVAIVMRSVTTTPLGRKE